MSEHLYQTKPENPCTGVCNYCLLLVASDCLETIQATTTLMS